jgi:hypothetical protein
MVDIKILALVSAVSCSIAFAQPAAVPTTAESPCQDNPGTDDVSTPLDSGFVSIFNGTDLKGWWNNCHGEDADHLNSSGGGIYKADPVIKAIYSQQRPTGKGGSALCTNKAYGNQEIILEYWADFGNDAGVYTRTSKDVYAYQTVLDYKSGNCTGGTYAQEMESSGNNFYNCAYWFGASKTAAFSGSIGNAGITDKSTLVQANMYDPNGWSELRIKMWGSPPHHQAWMRKLGGPAWIKTVDVTWPSIYSPKYVGTTGYIALQVHGADGGNRYWNTTTKGDWYRNIRIRELDATGNPIIPTHLEAKLDKNSGFSVTTAGLRGWLSKDFDVKVTDVNGKVLDSFHAKAGNVDRAFPVSNRQGLLFVQMRAGSESHVIRVFPL